MQTYKNIDGTAGWNHFCCQLDIPDWSTTSSATFTAADKGLKVIYTVSRVQTSGYWVIPKTKKVTCSFKLGFFALRQTSLDEKI